MNNQIESKLLSIDQSKLSHSHPYSQIIIPRVGALFLQTEEKDYIIDKHTIAYMPSEVLHTYRGIKENLILILNIPPALMKKTDAPALSIPRQLPIDEKIHHLIELIVLEHAAAPSSKSMTYLYFYLYDKIIETSPFPSIEYIGRYYQQEILIEELAKMEHYNVNYYREWFKKKTGLLPKEYISHLRHEKAKELLLTTDYSILEIALQVGYEHSSSFCRSFIQKEGTAPIDYRKQHRIKKE